MYAARSTTWQDVGRRGNRALGRLRACCSDNGVLVLSSGRPGVQLRFCADGRGEMWTEACEILPLRGPAGPISCGYTSLLATGADRFWIVYSDFQHNTPEGPRKAIEVREVAVRPKPRLGKP